MSLIYSMLSEAKAQSPVRRLWLITGLPARLTRRSRGTDVLRCDFNELTAKGTEAALEQIASHSTLQEWRDAQLRGNSKG